MAAKKIKLAQIKTKQNFASVGDFIKAIPDAQKRDDSLIIVGMMEKATGQPPKMWGSSIIGFGSKIYKSPKTERAVEWLVIGFSPRKANISFYMTVDIKQYTATLEKLGKYKMGAGCLYINKLEEIDLKVLKKLIELTSKSK